MVVGGVLQWHLMQCTSKQQTAYQPLAMVGGKKNTFKN